MNYIEKINELKAEITRLEKEMNEKPTAILRNIFPFDNVQTWDIGDIIQFNLTDGESIEAQCQKIEDGKAIFWVTHCLEKPHIMETDSGVSKWEETELRIYLNTEVLDRFPQEIRKKMIPIYKDDLLTIPSMEDIFGDWDYDRWKPKADALNNRNWKLMENKQYRSNGAWYWLRSSCYYSSYGYYWCYVSASGGASVDDGGDASGLAPAFAIQTKGF